MDKKIMAIVLIVCLVAVLCLWIIMSFTPGDTVQEMAPSGESRAKFAITAKPAQRFTGTAVFGISAEPAITGGEK
ncbi:hypothetical protein KY336_04910 [Candidatus Woesearchaeota archaeon]|nr:hypothetical protein [Candidatus Woesearchaeota archaeon]